MPQLGADMAPGTFVEWLKQPGDAVHRGDIVAVVETEKGAIEIEIFEGGVIDRQLVQPGARVPVGTVLALVRAPGEPGAPPPPAAETTIPGAPPPAQPSRSEPAAPSPTVGADTTRSEPATPGIRISPAAARLAAERHIDTATLVGTGPAGAIRIADIEAAATAAAPAKGTLVPGKAPPPAEAMRKAIAAAMARSKREIPHYYLDTAIDFAPASEWLTRTNAERPVSARLLHGVLLMKAVALALRDFPEFNGFFRDGQFVPASGIHVGTAIALRGGGLIAPAIHDTDRLTLEALMAALRDLIARARNLRLRSSEIGDPSITVTSLGERGVDAVFGVIYPPQVALIGFGRPTPRPWVSEPDRLVIRPVVRASLSADHRVSDGHRGALFLTAIERLLQEPEKL